MTKTGEYTREGNYVLRRENPETNYTVRLHFTQKDADRHIVEEIQEILTETYIRNFRNKEVERFSGEGERAGEKEGWMPI